MKAFSFVELLVALALSTVILLGAAGMIVLSKATVAEKLRTGDSQAYQARVLHTLDRDLSQIGLGFEEGLLRFDDQALTFMSARGDLSQLGPDLHFVRAVTAQSVTLLAHPDLKCELKHFGERPHLLRSHEGNSQTLALEVTAAQKTAEGCVLLVNENVALAEPASPSDWVGATLAHPTWVTWRFHDGHIERAYTRIAETVPEEAAADFSERYRASGRFRYFSRAGEVLSVAEADVREVSFVEIELHFPPNAKQDEIVVQRRFALQPFHLGGKS